MKRFAPPLLTATVVSLSLIAFASLSLYAGSYSEDPSEGVVQVTVVDVTGNPVPDAPIYISSGRHVHLLQGEKSGVITFSMPEGDYKLSSSVSKKSQEAIDRFASLEAAVHVVPGDTVSVFLTLYPLANPIPSVSLSTLHKMGIDDAAAANINN